MGMDDMKLMARLIKVADGAFDGHLTIMKFTGNWRVSFKTPSERDDIQRMSVGDTFAQAAKALLEKVSVSDNIYDEKQNADPD